MALRITAAAIFSWVFIGCESSSRPDEILDPRKVLWKIDSLVPPPGGGIRAFMDLWGTSRDNLYAVALSDGGYGQLWRFDGAKWKEQDFPRPLLGGYFISLNSIHGSSPSSIWAVGTNSYIDFVDPTQNKDSCYVIQFDGTLWRVRFRDFKGSLHSVFQSGAGDVWVGGSDGLLLKFDGSTWVKIGLPVSMTVMGIAMTSEGQLYCTGNRIEGTTETNYLLVQQGDSCVVQDVEVLGSSVSARFGILSLKAKANDLYSVGSGVFVRASGSWKQLRGNDEGPFRVVLPLSSNRTLAGSINSSVFYFEGSEGHRIDLPLPPNTRITGLWSNESWYIVVGYSFGLGKSYYAVSM